MPVAFPTSGTNVGPARQAEAALLILRPIKKHHIWNLTTIEEVRLVQLCFDF